MIQNSTITLPAHYRHHYDTEIVVEPTAINEIESTHYDSTGAAFFIVIVLLWYSAGLFFMFGMKIRPRADRVEDCARSRAKLFLQTLQDQTETKEILEELVDKQNREKLWKIYFKKPDCKDDLKRAEHHRIKNIQKQLETIHRNQMILNETIITPVFKSCLHRNSSDTNSIFLPTLSTIDYHPPRIQRRSSLDLQVLEQWKSIGGDQSQIQEQIPWSIRKTFICRQFRQYYKNLSSINFKQMNRITSIDSQSIDDEQCHLLRRNCPSQSLTRKSDERLNPYITYFHLPINENRNQHLPLITIRSDDHIVQFCDENEEYQMSNFSKV